MPIASEHAAAPRAPPAQPVPHCTSLVLGICFVPSATVWIIFTYRAMTLNWLLPLNSFHLALPTLSTKPLKETQLEKNKIICGEEKSLHNEPSFLPATLLGSGFPNTPQLRRRVCSAESVLSGTAGNEVSPRLGTKRPHAVPVRRARPGW